jgi:phage shock protein C
MADTPKLVRSRSDRILSGVCGGLARHLRLDPTLVRIVFVLLGALNGLGVILYLAMAVLVPREGEPATDPKQTVAQGAAELGAGVRDLASQMAEEAAATAKRIQARTPRAGQAASFWLGAALVLLGLWFLLRNFGLWPSWIKFRYLWPAALIGLGVLLLTRRIRER